MHHFDGWPIICKVEQGQAHLHHYYFHQCINFYEQYSSSTPCASYLPGGTVVLEF